MKPSTILDIDYRREIVVVMIFLGVVFTLISPVSGYFIQASKIELYLDHDLIVFGNVLSTRDVIDESNQTPRTEYEIQILQFIKGNTETEYIKVVGLGSNNSTRQLDNQTILEKGKQVILMLTREPDKTWFVAPYSLSSDSLNPDEQLILPPLRLYKAGILIEDIHCKSNLELALKSSNGNPVCLTSDSQETLLKRGWIK